MSHKNLRWQLLAHLWVHHCKNVELKFMGEYLEIGLPLAYSSWLGLITPTVAEQKLLDETWDAFVALCREQAENTSFLDDMRLAIALTEQSGDSNALGEQP
jgi:hypothetical protein